MSGWVLQIFDVAKKEEEKKREKEEISLLISFFLCLRCSVYIINKIFLSSLIALI